MSSEQGFFPEQFQQQCIELIKSFVDISAARFFIADPHMHIKGVVGYNLASEMEQKYQNGLAELDPMHPSLFEDSLLAVVSSNTVMTQQQWFESDFYNQFVKTHGYSHVADIFLRNQRNIVAIVTLLRSDVFSEFSSAELDLLKKLQPFIENTLNLVYEPTRIFEREYVCTQYHLTARELDVLEYTLTGANNKTLAQHLDMSLPTLRTHLQHIYEKVGVHSTSELIAQILQRQIKKR